MPRRGLTAAVAFPTEGVLSEVSHVGWQRHVTSAVTSTSETRMLNSLNDSIGAAGLGRGVADRERTSATELNCPRCDLRITPPTPWMLLEYCPRCIAHARVLVALIESQQDQPLSAIVRGAR